MTEGAEPIEKNEFYEINGAIPERAFRYEVDKRNQIWVVSYIDSGSVRVHNPSGTWLQMWVNAGKNETNVSPGQWMTVKVGSEWQLMSSADHR